MPTSSAEVLSHSLCGCPGGGPRGPIAVPPGWTSVWRALMLPSRPTRITGGTAPPLLQCPRTALAPTDCAGQGSWSKASPPPRGCIPSEAGELWRYSALIFKVEDRFRAMAASRLRFVGVDVVVCACVLSHSSSGWPVAPGEGVRPFTRCSPTALLGTHCVRDGRR